MIELPFPPASLSGHANGSWRDKAPVVKKHREWAFHATRAARVARPAGEGDIPLRVEFTPPDRRGDRVNYPNRMKPYLDGIAQALGINDRRFDPVFAYNPPGKPGKVVVTIGEPQQEVAGSRQQVASGARGA